MKLIRCLVYVVSHNSETKNVRFVDHKKCLYKKKSKGNFVRKNQKTKVVIKNVIWSKGIGMH